MASKMEQAGLPVWRTLLWQTLLALKEAPMPVSVDEAAELTANWLNLTEEQRAVPSHREGQSLVRFHTAHILSRLKAIGALYQPQPRGGMYALTDEAQSLNESEVVGRNDRYQQEINERRRLRNQSSISESDSTDDSDFEPLEGPAAPWQEDLLVKLKSVSPTAFEHLSAALLRAAGFDDVEVTGRSGDGGIDGIGVYRPSGLISFHTAFQCKRYQGSVGSSTVRDFRGSFVGRADRGIILTTGFFTREAGQEAARAGAPPVDLIDGDALCDLLKEHELGVRMKKRIIEDVVIDNAYFDQFEDSR